MGAEQSDPEQVDLFEFLRVVAVASYRGLLTRKQAALAQMVALDSDGTSGSGVVVRADHVALELGISVSQVWRQFGQLRDTGWFRQTSRPARGSKPGEGRRARYRTTCPPLDLGLAALPIKEDASSNRVAESGGDLRHDPAERVADSRSEARHDPAPNVSQDPVEEVRDDLPSSSGSCRSSDADRVAVSEETSRTPHAQRCDSLPSDGLPADDPTTPVVDQLPKPQDAREADPEAERQRQLAELEASPFWPQPNGAAEPVTKPPTEPDDQADAEPDIAEYDDLDQAQRLDLLASTEPPPEWDEVDDDHAAAS